MLESPVLFDVVDQIGLVRLNRPSTRNAIDDRVIDRLEQILDNIDQRPDVRALVIASAVEKAFCSGGDLDYFARLQPADALSMSRRMKALLNRVERAPLPVLAAVDGPALGGGCELLLSCHIRVCSAKSSFAFVQAERGLATVWGGAKRLVRIVGRDQAMRLLLTGVRIMSAEALRIGLIHDVVDDRPMIDFAQDLARSIIQKPAAAVSAVLQLTALTSTEKYNDCEEKWLLSCWDSRRFGKPSP